MHAQKKQRIGLVKTSQMANICIVTLVCYIISTYNTICPFNVLLFNNTLHCLDIDVKGFSSVTLHGMQTVRDSSFEYNLEE